MVLRLVSPRMFLSLWMLLLLATSGGFLVWSIQVPVMIQGKGLVVQPKAANGQNAQEIVVLLLFPPDQGASLKVKQPVSISLAAANITFHSTIQTIEEGTMSPAEISSQLNAKLSLAQAISGSGPSVVAIASVEPMSLAQTYLGSQCQVQVQIGERSILSLLPGYDKTAQLFHTLSGYIGNIWQGITQLLHQ